MTKNRYKNIFLFTGQGSQYHGMAGAFYRTEPVFRKWMDELDKIPLVKISTSVTGFLYAGLDPEGSLENQVPFDSIMVSHPALFMVQFSLAKTLIHYGIVPDCILGTSLGEYVALALAGVMPAQTILEALIDHARTLGACCAPGVMIGVAGSPGRYESDPVIRRNSSLAGISSPRHFVVSGDLNGMEKVVRHLEETDTGFQRLPVQFGFHSPNIEPALPEWEKKLGKMAYAMNPPDMDVISCCTGELFKKSSPPSPNFLADIGRSTIRFPDALKTLDREIQGQDRRNAGPVNILDLGPGALSSGFVRQNRILAGPVRIYRIMTLFGSELKNMNKIKAELVS